MNDFTKEELEGILLCISHGSWVYKADKLVVINKIQSMLDNYCEHNLKHILESRLKVIHYSYLLPGGDYEEKLIQIGQMKELQFIIKLIGSSVKCNKCNKGL